MIDWKTYVDPLIGGLRDSMEATAQRPDFHGEGDVWTHTMMVAESLVSLDGFQALDDRHQKELVFAALLHDIGKITVTREEMGQLTAPYHASVGEKMARQILWKDFGLAGTKDKQNFRETVCRLIALHGMPLKTMQDTEMSLRRQAAAGELCPDFSMEMLCLLSEADARGRVCDDKDELLLKNAIFRERLSEASCLNHPYEFSSPVTKYKYFNGGDVWPEQELYDESWGEVIMMCGLPGTGKDTWIARNCPELPVISLDDIRRDMRIKPEDNQGEVIQAGREKAKEYLRSHTPFVWNATDTTLQTRQHQLSLFTDYKARVRIVYLETPWDENLRRNASREYIVPEPVLEKMLSRMEPPMPYEAQKVEWITYGGFVKTL